MSGLIDWHELRAGFVGASEVGALFGAEIPEQDYLSEYALWHEKRGDAEARDNAPMRWGKRLEGITFQALREDYGLAVYSIGDPRLPIPNTYATRVVVADHDGTASVVHADDTLRASCTPDGFGLDAEGAYLVEAKATNWRSWAGWRDDFEERHQRPWTAEDPNAEDIFPASYLLQVTQQMALTGIHRAMLAVLVDGRELHRAWVEWRPEVWERMRERIASFWMSIEANVEPPPNFARSGDVRAIESLFRRRAREAAEDWSDRPGFAAAVERYVRARAVVKEAEEAKDDAHAEIMHALIGGPTEIRADSFKVSSSIRPPKLARKVTTEDVGRWIAGLVEIKADTKYFIPPTEPADDVTDVLTPPEPIPIARAGGREIRITEPKTKESKKK